MQFLVLGIIPYGYFLNLFFLYDTDPIMIEAFFIILLYITGIFWSILFPSELSTEIFLHKALPNTEIHVGLQQKLVKLFVKMVKFT